MIIVHHLNPVGAIFKGHGNLSDAGTEGKVPECWNDVGRLENFEWPARLCDASSNKLHAVHEERLPQFVMGSFVRGV